MKLLQSLALLAAGAELAFGAPAPPKEIEKRVSKFQFFGVNEAGAEFGNTVLPGQLGKDYIWPTLSTIDTFVNNGMNIFRVAFQMERLIPGSMTGTINQTYYSGLETTVNYITGKGAYALIEPHNFGRYYGNIITDTSGFGTYWKTVATAFKSNSKVIFDTNNEYHDMDQSLVVQLNQAAINAIRAAGATSQYIAVEGNAWSGAWTWTTSQNGATMGALTDPNNKILYEMHQYLDSDGSGTSATCVSTTIGQERLAAATAWLKANGKQGLLGEYAGGNNDVCKTAVKGMLSYMNSNTDVWKGALWWAAGPWWGDYIFSMEPTTGTAYTAYLSTILAYQ